MAVNNINNTPDKNFNECLLNIFLIFFFKVILYVLEIKYKNYLLEKEKYYE